jgi:hypothetical protein
MIPSPRLEYPMSHSDYRLLPVFFSSTEVCRLLSRCFKANKRTEECEREKKRTYRLTIVVLAYHRLHHSVSEKSMWMRDAHRSPCSFHSQPGKHPRTKETASRSSSRNFLLAHARTLVICSHAHVSRGYTEGIASSITRKYFVDLYVHTSVDEMNDLPILILDHFWQRCSSRDSISRERGHHYFILENNYSPRHVLIS